MKPAPFHQGERALQQTLGVEDKMDVIGRRVIRSFMPDQHRDFFASLPMILVGHVDARGQAWSSILGREPGFIDSPDATSLVLRALPVTGDPLVQSLAEGLQVGLLGLEFPTRRRNRANGRVREIRRDGFTIDIQESFGNCPKYIDAWDWKMSETASPGPEPFTSLDAEAEKLISASTGFFVASTGPDTGGLSRADVSHRGGAPGFVQIMDGQLHIPDYSGNRFFNTLGNFLVNPAAGLTFPDFTTGDVLQLTGDASVQQEGAERSWRFQPRQGQWLRESLPVRRAP